MNPSSPFLFHPEGSAASTDFVARRLDRIIEHLQRVYHPARESILARYQATARKKKLGFTD